MSYTLMDICDEDGVTEWFVSYFDTEGCEEDGDLDYVGISFTQNKEKSLTFETYGSAEAMLYKTGFSQLTIIPKNTEDSLKACCEHFIPK